MERRKHDKRTSGRPQVDKGGGRILLEEEEDYGDYVTRCICGFKHDDGYMICCDECSVWQHLECMQVDPKNLPDNYLCERCEPRPVDKRRAHKIQLKKRDDISDAEESRRRKRERGPLPRTPLATVETRKVTTTTVSSSASTPVPASVGGVAKKRKKRGKPDPKTDSLKKVKKEKLEEAGGVASKRQRLRTVDKDGLSSGSTIQSLLTAASLLEGGAQGEEEEEDHTHSHLWNAEESPWTDKYELAEETVLSEAVEDYMLHHLDRLRSEAVVYTQEEYASGMGPHPQHFPDQAQPPQCSIVDVAPCRRGLVVRDPVPQDELVMEFKGRVTVVKEVINDLGISGRSMSSLWKQKPCPFVYMYDRMSSIDLCIDARSYGNQARFIRRSCMPNAELRHFFVANDLHFGVYALDHLAADEEVTLPFDFQHEKCQYPMECGCGQTTAACLVMSRAPYVPAATSSRKSSAGMATDDEHVSVQSRTVSLQKSHSHVFTDDDSNMSWTSTSSAGRRKPRPHRLQSPVMGPETTLPSHGASSESDDAEGGEGEEPEKPRKSLSREERKTEQVWRVFEKMEASAQRKRQQLLSEGSHESDHASDASPIHALRTSKDRRLSSSSSRRAQLLPRPSAITMRHSSVSSMDPLSPYDPSEPFSPPLTPGLPPQHSPLLSPPLHYHVTPQLHPKYLFANFALPWKKAVLRQWEREQETGHRPAPRPYWDSNLPPLHGFKMNREMFRIRPRGCLKHRWLKNYHSAAQDVVEGEAGGMEKTRQPGRGQGLAGKPHPPPLISVEESGSDKENNGNQVMALPHKKQVLLRWKEAGRTKTTPPALSLPSTQPTQEAADGGKSKSVAAVSCKSPLFEEFSDNDELADHGGGRGGGFLLSDPLADSKMSQINEDGNRADEDLDSPSTPPLSALISDPTYTSLGSLVALMQAREDAPPPAAAPMETSGGGAKMEDKDEADDAHQLSGISDISLDSASEDKTPPPGEVLERDEGVLSPGKSATTEDQGAVDVSDVSSESLDGPAMSHATPPPVEGGEEDEGKGTDLSLMEDKMAAAGEAVEESIKPAEAESGSGLMESGSGQADGGSGSLDSVGVAPPLSPPSAQATPLKTPGKRKINLSEYRNRAARRPAERKGSSDKVSSTPPSTPGTPSFLATHPSLFPSVSSSPFASSLQLSTTAHAQSTDTTPHFEPVSPDEEDHAPKLHGRDDIASATPLMLAGRAVPPPMGVVSSGGVTSSLGYSCTPGSNLYNPYSSTIQNKGVLPGGVVAGCVVTSGVVTGGGLGINVLSTGIGGGVAGAVVGGGVAPVLLIPGGGMTGSYGMEGGVRWGVVEHDPRTRPAGVPPASSGVVISLPGAPGHHPPPALLQPPQVAVPAMSYATQPPQATVSGGSYPHQPPQPLNSGNLYMNQPPHGSAPGLFPGHPPGYYRPQPSQQQPLNPPPPGNQGGGPGLFRPRRPHPQNIGGNNPYY